MKNIFLSALFFWSAMSPSLLLGAEGNNGENGSWWYWWDDILQSLYEFQLAIDGKQEYMEEYAEEPGSVEQKQEIAKPECPICNEKKDLQKYCNSCPDFLSCEDCFQDFVDGSYESNGDEFPACPYPACNQSIREELWRSLITQEQYETWVGRREIPAGEIRTALAKATKKTMAWKTRRNTTKCYHCKARVERSGGCNHITCKCGAEFCMKCGSRWRQGCSSYHCGHPLKRACKFILAK